MIPGLREKMASRMRVAFTRSCVSFPKVDSNPITIAVWQVYAAVAYELGSTYPLVSPVVSDEVEGFAAGAVEQIINRKDVEIATVGMTPADKRSYSQIGFGLDHTTAMHLFRYRQQYRKDFMGITTMRLNALTSRRNNLANQLVDVVAAQAKITLSQLERGEGIFQTSPQTMSM